MLSIDLRKMMHHIKIFVNAFGLENNERNNRKKGNCFLIHGIRQSVLCVFHSLI